MVKGQGICIKDKWLGEDCGCEVGIGGVGGRGGGKWRQLYLTTIKELLKKKKESVGNKLGLYLE